MALAISQSATAVAPYSPATFAGSGGVEPYVYSVVAGGAGGSINSSTGVYTAPSSASSDLSQAYDTIRVTDSASATADATILVGLPILLLCEILQRELSLASGRVYLWDQKINQPSDNGLYIAVSIPSCKPFGNVNRTGSTDDGMEEDQSINMLARVDIDIISRGPSARDRKEEVLLALNSTYALQQQEANSFSFGKLSPNGGFLNLSQLDGAAIPYRYKITVNMQYAFEKAKAIDYFDSFEDVSVLTDP